MSNFVQGLVWNISFPNPLAKIITLKLADNANDEGGDIFPSINTICEKTGCSRAIVYKWITALEYPQVLKVVYRSAGGSQKDRTERAFDMELLRRLARPSRKSPPDLKLVLASVERPKTRDDGSPMLFDGAVKMIRIPVFDVVPFGSVPVRQKDGSDRNRPVRQKDGSPVRQEDGLVQRPVRQKDATRPPERQDPSATRTRTVKESVNEPSQGLDSPLASASGDDDEIGVCSDRQDRPAATFSNPFEGCNDLIPGDCVMDPLFQAIDIVKGKAPRPMDGRRLPFATSALVKLRRLCVDRDKLIARYFEKTAGKNIKNPSGYLVRMALEEVAKRDGVSIEEAEALYSEDSATRGMAMAAAVGAFGPPQPAAIGAKRTDAKALQESLSRLGGSIRRRAS